MGRHIEEQHYLAIQDLSTFKMTMLFLDKWERALDKLAYNGGYDLTVKSVNESLI